jgi:hypothetical protein
MSRVIVHRSLPPLKKVLQHFSHFPEGKSHQRVMTEELRDAAKILRTTSSKPFYAMREVADFFQAPLSNVARVYKVLEREGLINRIRSSQTMLVGKKVLSREAVRGVVGIPILMYSIAHLIYTRTLAMQLGEHLRRSGYVADIILYSTKEEETDREFAMRLLWHRLDAVILHSPLAGCRHNILSLRERGVRVLVIQHKEAQRDLPAVIYLEDYQPTYQKIAARWHAAGIRKVLLWGPLQPSNDQRKAHLLKTILTERGMDIEFVQDEPRQLLKRIRQRALASKTAVAFMDGIHSENICKSEPQVIERISQIARLAFLCGNDPGPYLQSRIRVDRVELSAMEIASKLANDILRLSVLPDGTCHTFTAHYHEQILL